MLGVSLDKPGNVWGLAPCPEDWLRASDNGYQDTAKLLQPLAAPLSGEGHELTRRVPTTVSRAAVGPADASRAGDERNSANQTTRVPAHVGSSTGTAADIPAQQVVSSGTSQPFSQTRDQLRGLVSELIQPLQADLKKLQQQIADGEGKRHALGLAVAQIPSVEERLWNRLRPYLEAKMAESAGALQTRLAELGARLESIQPAHGLTSSLRDLSARINAVDADLHASLQEQATTARQEIGGLADKIKAVERRVTAAAEQTAGVPDLVASQIAGRQEHLLAAMREYVKDIDALKRFKSDAEAALQQMVQVQGGFSALSDQVAQIKLRDFTQFQEHVDRLIQERAERTLSTTKALIDEQGTKSAGDLRVAKDILRKIESAAEALKERFQKTVTDAQQQTLAVLEHHINHTRDDIRKQIAGELQNFDSRVKDLSEEITDRMRQLIESVNRDREDLRTWFGQQTEHIHKAIQDVVLQADAEIKARNYINLETAKNSGQDLQREMIEQLQQRAHRASGEFEEEVNGRLKEFQTAIEASIGEALAAITVQVKEGIKSSEIELDSLAEEAIGHCRSALAENLKSIAHTLDVEPVAKGSRSKP